MIPENVREVSRADMHCHSTASQVAKLGVQRASGCRSARRPPRRSMSSPSGGAWTSSRSPTTTRSTAALDRRPRRRLRLRGADGMVRGRAAGGARPLLRHRPRRPRVPAGARARPRDLRRVPARARDHLRARASVLRRRRAAERPRHRRRLAELFPIWEVRNGSRARELNRPAAIYIETHGGTGIGGSDDHAGVDIGRTFTEAPAASTPEEFLAPSARGPRRGPRRPGQRREVGPRGARARHPQPAGGHRPRPRLRLRACRARPRRRGRPGRRASRSLSGSSARAARAAATAAADFGARRGAARCSAPGSTRSSCPPTRRS